jgi:cell division protein FtsI (penicillin-binding protein 3)
VPDFRGKTMRAVLAEASASGLPVEVEGRGLARAQRPEAGLPLPPGESIRVLFSR